MGGRVGGLFKRGKRDEEHAAQPASAVGDIPGQIATLAALRDQRILTEDDFTTKKSELLARL